MDAYELECLRKAGGIVKECREWAVKEIRPGVEIRHVLETIEEMTRERGGVPAFPAQSSRNHVAAHYCSPPEDPTIYQVGDCIKVDIGVHVDGYIADSAASVDLSPDGKWTPLVNASADALAAAIERAGPGVQVGDLGAAIERTIIGAGFQPVRNLTGHGLARWKVHTKPQIPNFGEKAGDRLTAGSVIAIEPFACTGRGYIREFGRAEVFMMIRPPRKAKALDREVLAVLDSWRGLPVARRYFRHLDVGAVEDTFQKLARQGSLMRFPPLVEEEGVMVTQTEHTLIITDDGVEVTTA